MNIILYFAEISLTWAIFYILYVLFLRKETFFNLNRWFLLLAIGSGILLPLVRQLPQSILSGIPTYNQLSLTLPIFTIQESSLVAGSTPALFDPIQWLLYLYITGLLIALVKFGLGIFKIFKIYNAAERIVKDNYTLVVSEMVQLPFSFLRSVYVNPSFLNNKGFKKILEHELTHIKLKHTHDILLIHLICILFWWNPLVYLYRRALKETHEYMADEQACHSSDLKNYGQILLGHSSSGIELALTHQFFNSLLKNRFNMLYKKKSAKHQLLRYALFFPCLFGLAILFSSQTTYAENTNSNSDQTSMLSIINDFTSETEKNKKQFIEKLIASAVSKYDSTEEVFKVAEEMPRFPGCENVSGSMKKKECAQKKMFEYIGNNLKYPKEARKNGTEGMAVIQFVVDTKGNITKIKLKKDLKDGCGAEALRVVKSMNDMPEKWIPGKQGGKKVNVEVALPFKFKL